MKLLNSLLKTISVLTALFLLTFPYASVFAISYDGFDDLNSGFNDFNNTMETIEVTGKRLDELSSRAALQDYLQELRAFRASLNTLDSLHASINAQIDALEKEESKRKEQEDRCIENTNTSLNDCRTSASNIKSAGAIPCAMVGDVVMTTAAAAGTVTAGTTTLGSFALGAAAGALCQGGVIESADLFLDACKTDVVNEHIDCMKEAG